MNIDTYEQQPAVEKTEDALAIFRQQVKSELAEKSEKGKLSEAALAKLRAIREQDKAQDIIDARFTTALRSVIVTPENLVKLIGRCNVSVPVTHIERRAAKLGWWIAAGYRLGEEVDGSGMVNFFSDLTPDERTMSDARFTNLWNIAAAEKLKASRLGRGLIESDEVVYRPCASGKKCMRFEKRKPAPASGNGAYCSPACAASDRARAKRSVSALPSAPTIQ